MANEQTIIEQSINSTLYEFDYYSGSQISIYIGEILIDDIEAIQFQVSQSKRPIYGYASYYYSKAAPGQVVVQGSFSIPFKEADYIIAALAYHNDQIAPITKERAQYKVLRENIERALEQGHTPTVVQGTKGRGEIPNPYEFYRDLAALPDEKFEDIAESFEDVLWEHPIANFSTPNAEQFAKTNWETDHELYRRGDQYPPFDIWILYGDIENAAANHTIKRIIDAEIVGQGQTISVGGAPISEQYSFIAKNLA